MPLAKEIFLVSSHLCIWGHMSGQKVAVCKCGCPRTMESSGLWHPPLVSHSLCSDLMVSLQSLSTGLDWVAEICQLWQLLYSILEMFGHSRKPSTPKTSTLHLSVMALSVHLQNWLSLVSKKPATKQSSALKRPPPITVCLACKEALVFGYTATYKRAQYCLFFLQTGSCVLLFYHL